MCHAEWWQIVRIGDAFLEEYDKLCAFLEHFDAMWNGSLGLIYSSEHRIELDPNTKSVHQPPFRLRSATRTMIHSDIDKLRAAGVVEHADTE